MKIVKLMAGVGFSLATIACGVEPTTSVDGIETTDIDFSTPIVGATGGSLSGTIGPVEAVNTPATRLGAWDDGTYLAVEAVGMRDDKAVMLFVSASNAADLFVPGTNEHFTFGDYDHEGAQVGLLGCVGSEVDVYDIYDAPADEVEIVVEPAVNAGPADVSVLVTGTWFVEHPGQETEIRTASTTFVLQR